MSATGRPKKSGLRTQRDPDDHYETPEWAVRAIWPHVRPVTGNVLDPCCGAGAIFRALCPDELQPGQVSYPRHMLFGVEIDRGRALQARFRAHAVAVQDFLNPAAGGVGQDSNGVDTWDPAWSWKPRLVLTNPPYKLAQEFVQRSLEVVDPDRGEVCMLLRLGFLASQKRGEWLRDHKPDAYVLSERPSFTSDGKTDASDYAWMVWGPERRGRLHFLPAEPYGREPRPRKPAKPRRAPSVTAVTSAEARTLDLFGRGHC